MRNSPESRQPSPIAFICLLALFSYFSINVIQTMTSEYSHQDKLISLEQQVAYLSDRKEQLKIELDSVKDERFIETEARNKLHMGKPNEKVVIFPQSTGVLSSTDHQADTEIENNELQIGYIGDWVELLIDN